MKLLGAFLLIGLLLGWGLGGGLRSLAAVRIWWWPVLPAALALQFAPAPAGETLLDYPLPVTVLLVSYAVLVVVVLRNRRLRGFMLILLGLLLNATVIALNRGMPVSREAAFETGEVRLVKELPTARGGQYHRATNEDRLLLLADVIAVREPFAVVVSVGDLATYAGAAVFLTAAMLGRPEPRGRDQAPDAGSTSPEPRDVSAGKGPSPERSPRPGSPLPGHSGSPAFPRSDPSSPS